MLSPTPEPSGLAEVFAKMVVVAAAANQRVKIKSALYEVVAIATVQGVVAAATVDGVIADARNDRVRCRSPG